MEVNIGNERVLFKKKMFFLKNFKRVNVGIRFAVTKCSAHEKIIGFYSILFSGDMGGGGADMSVLGSPPSSTVLALSSTSPLFGIPVSKPMSPSSSDAKAKGRKPSTPMSYMDHLLSPDLELTEPVPELQPSKCKRHSLVLGILVHP